MQNADFYDLTVKDSMILRGHPASNYAGEYVSGKNYRQGQIIMYQQDLYLCIQDGTDISNENFFYPMSQDNVTSIYSRGVLQNNVTASLNPVTLPFTQEGGSQPNFNPDIYEVSHAGVYRIILNLFAQMNATSSFFIFYVVNGTSSSISEYGFSGLYNTNVIQPLYSCINLFLKKNDKLSLVIGYITDGGTVTILQDSNINISLIRSGTGVTNPPDSCIGSLI